MIYLKSIAMDRAYFTAHDGHQGPWVHCRATLRRNRLFGGLMYYIILFIGVLSLLAVAAWLDPSRRQMFSRAAQRGMVQSGQTGNAAGDFAARLLKGERNEDKPCLTPIDCVRTKRCAGHCGCR